MTRLNSVNPAEATGATGEMLGVVKSSFGMVPNLVKVIANSEAGLEGYLGLSAALNGGTFDAPTREAIALTVAGANGCDYCASAHTAASKMMKVETAEIETRLSGHSADPKLDALLTFTRKVVNTRGFVGTEDIAAVREAGYDDGQIVEVIVTVALNVLTNYVNHVADTDVEFPKVDSKPYTEAHQAG